MYNTGVTLNYSQNWKQHILFCLVGFFSSSLLYLKTCHSSLFYGHICVWSKTYTNSASSQCNSHHQSRWRDLDWEKRAVWEQILLLQLPVRTQVLKPSNQKCGIKTAHINTSSSSTKQSQLSQLETQAKLTWTKQASFGPYFTHFSYQPAVGVVSYSWW